ncbi:MAG: hypothetical protein ABJB03_00445 [Rhodoglobus sp.]
MKRKPATPPRPDLTMGEPWSIAIEPVDGMMPFGRWRIHLQRGMLSYAGGDGWGWLAFTLRGARRKGARELRRLEARDARQARREQLEEATR